MRLLLWCAFVAALCTGCSNPEFDAKRHPDGAQKYGIYIRDAFGECYYAEVGRYGLFQHMKPEACERKERVSGR